MLRDSSSQIWKADVRQVQARAAQSHVFDGATRRELLQAIVTSMQDLDFQIDVLDETLGIVSGKKFEPLEEVSVTSDRNYALYNDESLIAFTKTFRTWGPFYYRDNVVRLTVTARKRGESQFVLRASAQYYLHAVEDPEPYQRFFRGLEHAVFTERALGPSAASAKDATEAGD